MTDGLTETKRQLRDEEKYQFRGYLPLIQEDGTVRVFGVSSGTDILGNAETLVFVPVIIPDAVARSSAGGATSDKTASELRVDAIFREMRETDDPKRALALSTELAELVDEMLRELDRLRGAG